MLRIITFKKTKNMFLNLSYGSTCPFSFRYCEIFSRHPTPLFQLVSFSFRGLIILPANSHFVCFTYQERFASGFVFIGNYKFAHVRSRRLPFCFARNSNARYNCYYIKAVKRDIKFEMFAAKKMMA